MLVLVRGSGVLYPLARGAIRIGATLQAVDPECVRVPHPTEETIEVLYIWHGAQEWR
jgi:hypothetical protein